MLEIYFKAIRDDSFKKIDDPRPGSWLVVKQATLEDLEKISQLASIDINDLKDSLDKHEIPRIEHLGECIIFFTRHPAEQESGLYTETLTILLTPAYLITISPHTSKITDQLLTLNLDFPTTQKSKLLLFILLRITQDFTNSTKRVLQAISTYKEPTRHIESNAVIVLTQSEEVLNQYMTTLVPLRNLMETLSTERYLTLYEKDLDLLEDLMNAIRQSEDLCRVNVKSIRSLRDSYHIVFTNDVNKTIKRLTALTILFSIPTMIASIYGMNVPLPYQSNPAAFSYVIGFAMVVCLASILVFLKNRWL